MIDHDRLFKELLTTFFGEFLELFAPDLAAGLDPATISFLDKEVFTDVSSGERHEVDLLARARLRGEDSFVLVRIEDHLPATGSGGRIAIRHRSRYGVGPH